MVKAQLFSKLLAQPCRGAKFKGFHAPAEAVTYDKVSGISKKGNFEITSFYDDADCLTKQVSRYVDKDGVETLKIKHWSAVDEIMSEIIAVNGKVKEFVRKIFDFEPTTEEMSCVTERLINTERGTRDYHEFALFKKGQKPKKMSYRANWDGNAPEIKYTNIKTEMPREGLEYMPLLASFGANPRHRHLSRMYIKEYGLEGIATEAKKVEFTELNPEYKSFKEALEVDGDICNGYTSFTPPTGEVFINEYLFDAEELIRVYSHEYKHVDDLSHFIRLRYNAEQWKALPHKVIEELKENEPEMFKFIFRSIKKGIIDKHGPDAQTYRYYKHLDNHFSEAKYERENKTAASQMFDLVEVGPIRKSKEELKKFELLQENIRKILHSD